MCPISVLMGLKCTQIAKNKCHGIAYEMLTVGVQHLQCEYVIGGRIIIGSVSKSCRSSH